MNKLITDFDNRIIVILSDERNQKDVVEMAPENQKRILLEFFPNKKLYMRANNFTWDFECSIIEANNEVNLDKKEYDVTKLEVLAAEEVPDLAFKQDQIMDLLGFNSGGMDEKFMEYMEFIEKYGMPPTE